MKPHLVITNDDGIGEPGIFHLAKALAPFYEITVVAPKFQQSGKGLGITLHSPLNIEAYDFKIDGVQAYQVNGTPADCVKMAISKILNRVPDAIISGINPGDNSGRNALYSGTVGATIEASMRGITGIAFSCIDFDQPPFEEFCQFIPQICDYFLKNRPPFGTVINVNCPSKDTGSIQGVKLATQGMGYWCENSERIQNSPMLNHDHYLGASWQEHPETHDSDITLLRQGYIAAVPMNIAQLTNLNHFNQEANKFEIAISSLLSSLS